MENTTTTPKFAEVNLPCTEFVGSYGSTVISGTTVMSYAENGRFIGSTTFADVFDAYKAAQLLHKGFNK